MTTLIAAFVAAQFAASALFFMWRSTQAIARGFEVSGYTHGERV